MQAAAPFHFIYIIIQLSSSSPVDPMRNQLIMHVHPSSPNSSISEDNAAIKIQANFRGYRVRKQIKDTTTTTATDGGGASSMGGGGCPGATAVAVVASGSTAAAVPCLNAAGGGVCACSAVKRGSADRALEQSATKIQAGVRGYLVRKKQRVESEAATKIQANFRGFKTRQQLKQTTKTCEC